MSSSAAHRAFGRRFRIAATGATLLLAVAALVPASGAATAAGSGLACDQHTIYGIGNLTTSNGNTRTTTAGVVKSIAVDGGTTGDVTTLTGVDNALGIADGGGTAYAFKNGGTQLDVYDAVNDTTRTVPTALAANTQIIRGAVNPVTGVYYFATGGADVTVYAYDPTATPQVVGKVGTIHGVADGNGDFAFSTSGVLFLAARSQVLRVNEALPRTAGNADLSVTQVAALPDATNSPGIAFSSDGYLYVAASPNVLKIDPGTGAQVQSIQVGTASWALTDLASCTYANTVTGIASTGERVRAGDQFTVTVTGGGITKYNTGTSSGTGDATAGPVLALATTRYTVTQTAAGTTKSDGSGALTEYDTTWTCDRTSESGSPVVERGTGSVAQFAMPSSSGSRGTDVTCSFTNTPKHVTIRLASGLTGSRIDPADQFTVTAAGVSATTTGTGSDVADGDTGVQSVIVGREYTLTQAMADGSSSDYGQYAKTIACQDDGTSGTTLPAGAFDGSASVTPAPGAVISCTVSAKPAPASITLTTTLGGARYADQDQFTVGLLDVNQAAVGDASHATTTGGGQTVDAGSGTITVGDATAGSAYTLTQAADRDAERYSRTITCTDAKGFQQDEPSGTFGGSASITPVPGAQLTCTVDAAVKGAGLTVSTALTDPRFDAADQFTAAISTGGGVVSTQTNATTQGSGNEVTTGTGTTGRYTTTSGTAYTITDAAGGHAERYEQTISCTDRNAAAGTAPTTADFDGSYTVTAQRGQDLDCTVTAAAKRPVVTVTTRLGSERFVAGDQFTTALRDAAAGTDQGTSSTETTTGSGDQVGAGTGTTGAVRIPAGSTAIVAGSPTANADRYVGALSCVDGNHLEADVTAASFDGTKPLTPAAGTAYTCAITWTARSAAITATVALGSARSDDGDQWHIAWRTGGPSGTERGATTTTGTGNAVQDGSTGAVMAANGVAYTVTDTATAHSARYATSLTCTDAEGKQTTGLPSGQPFDGSAVITPQSGADLRCTLTTSLRPAALALQLAAPAAAQVAQPATWTATLTNSGGAAARGAVSFALPAGLDYADVHGTGWSCAVTDRTVSCTGPDVTGGDTGTFDLLLTPARGSEGAAALRAAVDPAGAAGAVAPAACSGTDAPVAGCVVTTTTVGSTPHLVLGVTPPAAATVGAPATWKGTVTNDGTGASGDATVALLLPEGLGSVTTTGADCTADGRRLVCRVPGPIADGGSAAFTVTGTPAASAAGTDAVLAGRLDPAGTTTTGDPADCTVTGTPAGCAVPAGVRVGTGVALGVTVTPPAQLTEGVPAGYAVAVTNTGTGPDVPAVVAVHLPDGLAYSSASGADCTATGADLVCRVAGGVPAGGTTSFVVTVVPADGTAGTAVAPAAAVTPTGGTTPPAATGCTATPTPAGCAVAAPRTVQPAPADFPAGLVLTGTVRTVAPAGAQVVAGDRVRYSYTVTNRTGTAVDHLVVSVPGLGEARCAATSLAAGAATTCELGPVTVTQAQVDAGLVSRDAAATAARAHCAGTCPAATSNTVTLTAPVRAVARIGAVQTVHLRDRNRDGVAELGETVDFQVRVTNTGTVTLSGVRLTDGLVGLTCPSTTLAPGASMVCTGSHVTTAADVAAGGIRNVATASAKGVAKLGTVSSQRTVGAVKAAGKAAVLAHTGSTLPAGLLAGSSLLGAGALLLVGMRRRRRDA